MRGESTATVINRFREYMGKKGTPVDDWTDEDVIERLGRTAEGQGFSVADKHGASFYDSYLDIKNRPEPGVGILGDMGREFARSSYGVLSGLGRAGQLASEFTGARAPLLERWSEVMHRKAGEVPAPSIERPTDIRMDRPGEVARGGLIGLAAAAPSVIEAGLSGLGGGGLVAAGLRGSSRRAFMRDRVKKGLQKSQDELQLRRAKQAGLGPSDSRVVAAREKAKDISKDLLDERTLAMQHQIGTGAVMFGNSVAQNTGEVYNELFEYTKLDPTDPEYISETEARITSVLTGVFSGIPDSFLPYAVVSKVQKAMGRAPTKKEVADFRSFTRKSLMALPRGMVLEGSTESLQEWMHLVGKKYIRGDSWNPADWNDQEIRRLWDAGILGALGGAEFSMVGIAADAANLSKTRMEDSERIKQMKLIEKAASEAEIIEKEREEARLKGLQAGREYYSGLEEEKLPEIGDKVSALVSGITGTVSAVDEETGKVTIEVINEEGIKEINPGISKDEITAAQESPPAATRTIEIVVGNDTDTVGQGKAFPSIRANIKISSEAGETKAPKGLKAKIYKITGDRPADTELKEIPENWTEVGKKETRDAGNYAVAFTDEKTGEIKVKYVERLPKVEEDDVEQNPVPEAGHK